MFEGVDAVGVAFATVAVWVAAGEAAPALLPPEFVIGVPFELLEQALSRTPAAETPTPITAPRRSKFRRDIEEPST